MFKILHVMHECSDSQTSDVLIGYSPVLYPDSFLQGLLLVIILFIEIDHVSFFNI